MKPNEHLHAVVNSSVSSEHDKHLIALVKQVITLHSILMQTWLLSENMHLQFLTQGNLLKFNLLVQIAKQWKVFQLLMQL